MPFPSLSSPPALFPTYLVPSLPFRRRRQSSSSSSSTSASPPSSSESYLSSTTSHLRCTRCLSDLALSTQIISKGFTGRHGRAYLVSPTPSSHHSSPPSNPKSTTRPSLLPNLPNTYTHKPVPRQLVTGAHTVGDISCAQCGSVLGWKYVSAEDEGQRYKIGKFILETKRVCRMGGWDVDGDEDLLDDDDDGYVGSRRRNKKRMQQEDEDGSDDVEFDSQDEEECDALFAGQWTADFAREVRRKRVGRIGRVEE